MGSQQQFCLRWNNHQLNMLNVFEQLLQNEAFVDVTLACDGLSLKAHKVVLSACSPYFHKLLLDNPCQHPIVILKDVNYADLKALVDFMYKGEVNVLQDQLQQLLRTAELLKIKGLSEVSPMATMTQPLVGPLISMDSNDNHSRHRNCGTATIISKDPSSSDGVSVDVLRSSTDALAQPNDNASNPSSMLPASSSMTSVSRSAPPTGCPPSKRKKLRPRQKSGSVSDSEDAAGATMLEMEGPPEVIETKVDVMHDSMNIEENTGNSQETTRNTCNLNNGIDSITKDDDEVDDDPCHPRPKIHEGFSQDGDDTQTSNLDPPTLLGISNYTSVSPHPYHQSLPSQLSDVDDASKSTILKLEDFGVSTNASSMSITTTTVPTSSPLHPYHPYTAECGRGVVSAPVTGASGWPTYDVTQALDAIRQGRISFSSRNSPGGCSAGVQPALAPPTWQQQQQQQIQQQQREILNNNRKDTAAVGMVESPMTTRRDLSFASNWTEDDLHQALDAVKTGRLSITKAAVTFGIPNTTLWQRTRREGIETSRGGVGGPGMTSPHQANWTEANLAQALDAIRMGRMSVNKASSTFGIPSTTLWSRAKRYGIETGRKSVWEQERDETMWQALQAVKNGLMSMTQASIKFSVPYTTLWKHFKKWEMSTMNAAAAAAAAVAAASTQTQNTSSTCTTTCSSTPPASSATPTSVCSVSTCAATSQLNMSVPPHSLSLPPPPHHPHHHHHHHHPHLPHALPPHPAHSMALGHPLGGIQLPPPLPPHPHHSHPVESILSSENNTGTSMNS